jgi:hypothetical protein
VVLDAVRHSAKAVGETEAQADRFASLVLVACCVRDLDNPMTCSKLPALCSNLQPIGEHGHDN